MNDMPPGTLFTYLGRPCVVHRYAGESEHEHTGVYGMVYEYADERGEIHRRAVSPRDYAAFRAAVEVDASPVKNPDI